MDQITNPKPKSIYPKLFWAFLFIFFVLAGIVGIKAYQLSGKVFVKKTSFIQRIQKILFQNSSQLVGEDQDEINILVLGYRGESHDGPFLTDTMILVTVHPKEGKVLLTSIPRDYLWDTTNGNKKINSAFVLGLQQNGDFETAGKAATQSVEKMSGMVIPYFVSLDFKGFKKAIDKVGGLDITVPRSFSDSSFPDDNYGYLPTVTFQEGPQHMDGERALEYARSRHGTNGEGSDFARSRRQAQISEAFKTKLKGLNVLENSSKIEDLLTILSNHLHTNLEPSELVHLSKLVKENNSQILNQSLDPNTTLLCEGFTETDRQYIVEKCPGVETSQITNYIEKGFEDAGLKTESASIILENGGVSQSQYLLIKNDLTASGLLVAEVAYKGIPLQRSILYEIRNKPATEKYIQDKLNISAQPLPAGMKASTDLVLIVAPQ